MATADPMADTPSRLLRRVQQMEDMELPSLPSIQHEIDYDSESTSEGETSMDRSAVSGLQDESVGLSNLGHGDV